MQKNILLIGSNNVSNRRIKNEVEALDKNVKCFIVSPDEFQIFISNVSKRDEIYLRGARLYANSIHGIIPRIGKNLAYGATVVKHLNENLGIPSTSNADGLLIAANKLTCGQAMSKAGLILPKTMYLQTDKNINFIIQKLGGLGDGKKIVAKLVQGSQGSAVMILESLLGASTVLSTFMKIKKSVLLQQFLRTADEEERSWDIRAFVVNGKVVAAIKRFALDGDFRSNISISKQGENIELTPEQKQIAIKAASSIDLAGVNGVDLAVSKDDGKTYIIECNGHPSLIGISKYSGVNVAEEIAKYALQIAKGKTLLSSIKSIGEFKSWSTNSKDYTHFGEIDTVEKVRILLGRDEVPGISKDDLDLIPDADLQGEDDEYRIVNEFSNIDFTESMQYSRSFQESKREKGVSINYHKKVKSLSMNTTNFNGISNPDLQDNIEKNYKNSSLHNVLDGEDTRGKSYMHNPLNMIALASAKSAEKYGKKS